MSEVIRKQARKTLLTISTLILAFNYVDRQVLALVLQSIKTDLNVSDTQLGFLSGIAFAAFYAVMGIPIARLADRGDRVKIISITAAVWSVFVAMCGATASFAQLFLIRVGVAVGEAGCIPPAQSLLSEFFPRAERARAFAIYSLGIPLSVILGGFLAGWINQYFGWRATFVMVGCPGVVLSLLAWFLLREPRRFGHRGSAPGSSAVQLAAGLPAREPIIIAPPAQQSLKDTVWILAQNATFRHLLFAQIVLYFFLYGVVVQWQPTFFIRTFALSTGEIGTWQLLSWALMGTIGMYAGGAIVHRFMANNERLQLRLMAITISIYGMLNILIYLSSHRYWALGLTVIAAPFYNCIFGPMYAVTQSVVPGRFRAIAVALTQFFANLIGMGLGGLAVGMLSDALTATRGSAALGYALLCLSPGFFWVAIHFWLASRTAMSDIEKAHQ
jgi:MFS family permease